MDAKARGHVRVHVRVLPHETVDVVAKGAELHEDLMDGLAIVCGDKVEDVSLEFVEPESVTLAGADDDAEAAETAAKPAAKAPVPDTTSEITQVSMSARARSPSSSLSRAQARPEPAQARFRFREGGVGHGGREDSQAQDQRGREGRARPEPAPAAPEPGSSADEGRIPWATPFATP